MSFSIGALDQQSYSVSKAPRFDLATAEIEHPDDPKAVLRAYHAFDGVLDGRDYRGMDELVGWSIDEIEDELAKNYTAVRLRAPGEEMWLGGRSGRCGLWSDYTTLRSAIQTLEPKESEVVYDLGAGYGRMCIYGAVNSDARFRGIELVPERVADATGVAERLEIPNVDFVLGSVLDVDFTDGDAFYMFNPFSAKTMRQVLDRLDRLAAEKPITLLTHWTHRFAGSEHLRELPTEHDSLSLYRSAE